MLPPKIPLFKCFLPGKQSSLHWAVNFRTWLLSNTGLKTRRFVLPLHPPRSSEDSTGFIKKIKKAFEIQRQDRADLHRNYSCLKWSFALNNLDLRAMEMLSPSLPRSRLCPCPLALGDAVHPKPRLHIPRRSKGCPRVPLRTLPQVCSRSPRGWRHLRLHAHLPAQLQE